MPGEEPCAHRLIQRLPNAPTSPLLSLPFPLSTLSVLYSVLLMTLEGRV